VGRMLLKVAHVALVNLLAGRRLVPELLQGDMTPERIAGEVRKVWLPGAPREQMLQGLAEVRGTLGSEGAAQRAAEAVLELLPAAAPRLPE
jgi:lipid-A-disaccharide synthase